MQTIYTSIVATLAFATLATAHDDQGNCTHAHAPALASTTAAPLPPVSAEGGLVGFGAPSEHVHGENCVSAADRAHMKRGMLEYISEFGPLSQPSTRGAEQLYPIFPVGAREWEDLFMFSYVDLNANEDAIQDWNCGEYTYDGHRGIDAYILTFERQFIGVPIIAPLDGTVYITHDGEPDQNTELDPDSLSNYVGIDHGQGRYVNYFHMKQGSVVVEVGQEVRAGEQIGLVASSGYSNWPHLHFESWDYACDTVEECVDWEDWALFEPYAGDCNVGNSGWVNQVDIPVGTVCKDFGVTTANLDDFFANQGRMWMPPLEGYVPLDHDKVWMWAQISKIDPFSTYQMRFYDPDGNVNYDSGTNWLNPTWLSFRFGVFWFNWDIPGLHEIPGTWTVDVMVNDAPFINFPLTIVSPFEQTPNRAPQPIAASFRPSTPTTDDFLTCNVYTQAPLDDLDWDLVRYHYTWSVGGRVVRDIVSAGQADHLPRLEGCDGAVVQCTVVPSDGIANGTPYTAVVRLAGASLGDVNCDGNIDITDLLIVLGDWGTCSLCSGDLNGDGEVDVDDMLTAHRQLGLITALRPRGRCKVFLTAVVTTAPLHG